jgi:hypothetical protein
MDLSVATALSDDLVRLVAFCCGPISDASALKAEVYAFCYGLISENTPLETMIEKTMTRHGRKGAQPRPSSPHIDLFTRRDFTSTDVDEKPKAVIPMEPYGTCAPFDIDRRGDVRRPTADVPMGIVQSIDDEIRWDYFEDDETTTGDAMEQDDDDPFFADVVPVRR